MTLSEGVAVEAMRKAPDCRRGPRILWTVQDSNL